MRARQPWQKVRRSCSSQPSSWLDTIDANISGRRCCGRWPLPGDAAPSTVLIPSGDDGRRRIRGHETLLPAAVLRKTYDHGRCRPGVQTEETHRDKQRAHALRRLYPGTDAHPCHDPATRAPDSQQRFRAANAGHIARLLARTARCGTDVVNISTPPVVSPIHRRPRGTLRDGRQSARRAVGGAGRRTRRKRMACCNGLHRASNFALTRKGADFREVRLSPARI